jgi:hypothetical protein
MRYGGRQASFNPLTGIQWISTPTVELVERVEAEDATRFNPLTGIQWISTA